MKLIDYLRFEDTREFLAVFHEENSIELNQIRFKMTDKWDLNEDTPEVRIAICEKVEEIDRLEVGQSIPFNPFRGEEAGNGFILRMK